MAEKEERHKESLTPSPKKIKRKSRHLLCD
jgi:hypothetical protein